ncbi:MAG: nucleotidyl transferase AbiEii/AbiGii toxin family protein [Candidatus Gracilibacteria bacterium]|jgi:predicted nucleotidyltransferase component of viral defense system
MIPKREILESATNNSLTPHVIEKDYVLGWILAGINNHAIIANSWIFKGGTCLKKCYFDTYRFSEDLDFTLRDESHINADFLLKTFSDISKWIYEFSGIEIPPDRMIFDVYENPRGKMSCQGRLFYKGPATSQSKNAMPRIKLDLSVDEIVVAPTIINSISHAYSDLPQDGFHIQCYSYEEVFAEKIRALAERTRPRDLYDVINFYRRPESEKRAMQIKGILRKKCEFKGIEMPTYSALQKHKDECQGGWVDQLNHQLQALPPFESFWNELPDFFNWLESPTSPLVRIHTTIPVQAGTVIDQSDIGLINSSAAAPQFNLLDRIRFAAANYLCVEIIYHREDGAQNTYLIEPYSLRRTSDNHLLLYSLKHNTADIRAFRTDRIINAIATTTTFTPKYRIEFLPSAPLNPGGVVLSYDRDILGVSKRKKSSNYSFAKLLKPSRSRSSSFGSTIKYIYQCPFCRKTFHRSSMDSKLNPHKNKQGWQCSGKTGVYIKTKY